MNSNSLLKNLGLLVDSKLSDTSPEPPKSNTNTNINPKSNNTNSQNPTNISISNTNTNGLNKNKKRVTVSSVVHYPRVTVPHTISEPITELQISSASPLNNHNNKNNPNFKNTSKHKNKKKLLVNTFIHSDINNINMGKTEEDYNQVREAIKKVMPREGYDDGSTGPILVRLAWHASGTYDAASGTGGSNGATMRYYQEATDEANNGLECARMFLEPVKAQFPWITYADLWTLAGAVALEELGGPHIDWKPGRVDYLDEQHVPPNGRLPDGGLGQDHLRDIFYRMGFNDQEIVALCGAHNLGRTHANRSGFDGPWVPNPTRFSNTYFQLLLEEDWKWGKSPAGLDQFYDEDGDMMMLPADMSLIKDPEFRKWVEKYAEDKELFFDHFAKVFAKLLELGVRRDKSGIAQVNRLDKLNHNAQQKL